jgi:hypothetical protein
LECLAWAFPGHLAGCKPAQFLVEKLEQPFGGLGVALLHCSQQKCGFTHGRVSRLHRGKRYQDNFAVTNPFATIFKVGLESGFEPKKHSVERRTGVWCADGKPAVGGGEQRALWQFGGA